MQRAQEIWRSKGAIGKLHNLVKAIRAGPQRLERFKQVTIGDSNIDSKFRFSVIYKILVVSLFSDY